MAGHLQRTQPTRNFPKGGWEARWQEDVNGRPKWREHPARVIGKGEPGYRVLPATTVMSRSSSSRIFSEASTSR